MMYQLTFLVAVRHGLIEVRTAPAVIDVHGRWTIIERAAEATRWRRRPSTLLQDKPRHEFRYAEQYYRWPIFSEH